MLQRSTWSGLVLSAAVLSAVWLPGSRLAWADDAPATGTAPAASAPATSAPAAPAVAPGEMTPDKLKTLADDFMHYSLVNNPELAKANAQAILDAKPELKDLVTAFEAAANGRDPIEIMTRNERRDDLRDVSKQLQDRLEEGYRTVARDQQRIRNDIERLGNGPRAYANARDHLVAAGQFAAPIYIEYLQNGQKKSLQPYILRVMVETGRPMVLPLVQQLETNDDALRATLVNLLGQIGYKQALPALKALAGNDKLDAELKKSVNQAIGMIDRTGSTAKSGPAPLYLDAAESYYDKKPSYQPQLANEKTNPVWSYDKGLNNVVSVAVPTQIWGDVMAARSAELALRLDNNNCQAISLWLAAQLKKEILLAGAADPTMVAGKPDAAFYALAAGPVYVNPVLTRALDAHDAALALRAIDALESTGGTNGLVSSGAGSPLVRALAYPDRTVRFRAAFALARANPASAFPSHFRVVPVLAEAISSTGTSTALVVAADENTRNKIADTLRNGSVHYSVFTGANLTAALDQAHRAPAFDVVIVTDSQDRSNIYDAGRTDYRLTGATVLTAAPAANLLGLKAQGIAAVDEAGDDAAVATALGAARGEAGNAPVDADKASQFSATAIKLLAMLAADHKSIYNVADALNTLTDALKDKRTDIATGAAGVLGELRNTDAQKAIATAALSTDVDPAVRAPFFNALADSAKNSGNALDSSAINSLIKVVSSEPDPAIRNAAAAALGALNVPSNQAAPLILQQAK